jgi:hypothetical protein
VPPLREEHQKGGAGKPQRVLLPFLPKMNEARTALGGLTIDPALTGALNDLNVLNALNGFTAF